MSICPIVQTLQTGLSIPLVLYNPIGFTRSENVRLPVPSNTISVLDESGKKIIKNKKLIKIL